MNSSIKPSKPFQIVPMEFKHLDAVVDVHILSFPGFFLTFLGFDFLKLLYGEILKAVNHIAFVAIDQHNTLIGFVVGVTGQSGFYSRLARRRWFAFASTSLGAIVRQPFILPRLVRALNYSRTTQAAISQALLMSIAVHPKATGLGAGQNLAACFLEAMKNRDVRRVSLSTDRDNNERTNSFYQNLGFQIERTYCTPEGRWMNEYVIDL